VAAGEAAGEAAAGSSSVAVSGPEVSRPEREGSSVGQRRVRATPEAASGQRESKWRRGNKHAASAWDAALSAMQSVDPDDGEAAAAAAEEEEEEGGARKVRGRGTPGSKPRAVDCDSRRTTRAASKKCKSRV